MVISKNVALAEREENDERRQSRMGVWTEQVWWGLDVLTRTGR